MIEQTCRATGNNKLNLKIDEARPDKGQRMIINNTEDRITSKDGAHNYVFHILAISLTVIFMLALLAIFLLETKQWYLSDFAMRSSGTWHSWVILFGGLFITLLVGSSLSLGLYRAIQAEKLSKQMSSKNLELRNEINERSKAQQELARQRQEYRIIFDSVPGIIAYIGSDGQIKRINRSGAAALGSTPKELVGKSLHEILAPDIAEKILGLVRDASQTDVPIFGRIGQYQLPTGRTIWFHTDIIPYADSTGQVTGAIGVVQDITERKKYEESLAMGYETLKKSLNDVINMMARIVETRDPYTAGHQQRVTDLALAIARELELGNDTVDLLRMASTIHDIGKMYVPSEILSKPGKLGMVEFELLKAHSQSGYDIVKSVDFPVPVADIILQHHERLDGSGYPRCLKDKEILLEAKILAVADTVEAMASHRPYRAALGIDKALEQISSSAGILYDKAVVDACLRLFIEKGFAFDCSDGIPSRQSEDGSSAIASVSL